MVNFITSAREGVEKRDPYTVSVGMQVGAVTVENSMEVPQKTKKKKKRKLKKLACDPATPLLGIYSDRILIQSYMLLYFHSSTAHNNQDMETN